MKKVIAAFNMTLDGVCDHTTGIADEEIHAYYSDLIDNGSVFTLSSKGKDCYYLTKSRTELF